MFSVICLCTWKPRESSDFNIHSSERFVAGIYISSFILHHYKNTAMKRNISLHMHCLSFTIVCIGLDAQLARRSKDKSQHRGFTALVASLKTIKFSGNRNRHTTCKFILNSHNQSKCSELSELTIGGRFGMEAQTSLV